MHEMKRTQYTAFFVRGLRACDHCLNPGAVELRNALSASFQLELSSTVTFDHPTVTALAAHIAGKTLSYSNAREKMRIFEFDSIPVSLGYKLCIQARWPR